MEDAVELQPLLKTDQVVINVEGDGTSDGMQRAPSTLEMHLAADLGEEKRLEYLVQNHKEDIGRQDENGCTPLHLAARGVHLQCCEILLRASVKELRIKDKHGNTPLMLSITSGKTSFETASLLVSKGAKVNVANLSKVAPLHIAADVGSKDICQLILEKDRSTINAENVTKQTALHSAAMKGHARLCQFLVENGVNIEAKDSKGYTALHYAAQKAFTECCNQLLTFKAEVNCIDKKGDTPLHLLLSSKAKKPNCMEVLCKRGAQVSIQNKRMVTPFHLAQLAPKDMMEKLLDFNPDPFIKDYKGRTALHYAAERRNSKHIDILLKMEIWKTKDKSKFVNIQDKEGHTALHVTIMKGNSDDCKELMKYGADINVACGCHGNVLHLAAEKGLQDMCDYLPKFIKVNGKNSKSQTPLHIAAKGNFDECCRSLIKNKASAAMEDIDGNVPLHIAAKEGKDATCKVLMSSLPGSENRKNNEGYTPLQLAVKKGSLACCEVLAAPKTKIWGHKTPSAFQLAYQNYAARKRDTDRYESKKRDDASNDSKKRDGDTKKFQDICIHLLHSECIRKTYNQEKDVDFQDILHEEIKRGNKEMVSTILNSDFWEEALLPVTKPEASQFTQNDNFRLLVEHFPRLAKEVLDKCKPSCDPDSSEENINKERYFMHFLDEVYITQDEVRPEKQVKKAYEKVISRGGILVPDVRIVDKIDSSWREDHVLSWMLRTGRRDLIEHPVVTCWLNYKWKKYVRYGHFLSVFLSILLAIGLTVYNSIAMDWALMATKFSIPITRTDVCVNHTVGPEVIPYLREQGHSAYILGWVITVFVALIMLFEIYKIVKLRLQYIKVVAVIHWLCMILTFLFVGNYTACSFTTNVREDIQWLAGLMAILLAWLHFFLLAWIHPRNPFVFDFKRFLRALVAIVPPIAVVGVAIYAIYGIGSKGSLSYYTTWKSVVEGFVSLPKIVTAVAVGLASFIYLEAVNTTRPRDKTLRKSNVDLTLDFDMLYPFLRKKCYAFWVDKTPDRGTKSRFKTIWKILECCTEGDEGDGNRSETLQNGGVEMQEMRSTLTKIERLLVDMKGGLGEGGRREEAGGGGGGGGAKGGRGKGKEEGEQKIGQKLKEKYE